MPHGFDEKWGTIQSHDLVHPLSKRSEELLHDLGPKHCTKLTGWLAELVDNAPDGSKEARVDTWLPQRYTLIEESARTLIDNILLHLQKFAAEFNDSDIGEHLQMVFEHPKDTFDLPCRRDPSFSPYKFTCYEGHLTTYNWALLVRSYYENVEVFLVPAEMLLGLRTNSLNSSNVKPLAEFRPAVKDDRVMWALAGVAVELEAIPAMCRELFGDFVKVAMNAVDASELFLHTEKKEVHSESEARSEEITADIKDLQLWQARGLFSRALKQDSETLLKLSRQSEMSAADHVQIEKLTHQIGGLQKCWLDLLQQLPCEAAVIVK